MSKCQRCGEIIMPGAVGIHECRWPHRRGIAVLDGQGVNAVRAYVQQGLNAVEGMPLSRSRGRVVNSLRCALMVLDEAQEFGEQERTEPW